MGSLLLIDLLFLMTMVYMCIIPCSVGTTFGYKCLMDNHQVGELLSSEMMGANQLTEVL